ncbi:MAG: iron donor protein CyaY [Zoogloeaceae bacterium]|jgi:CyaY protein|nr:iron donor protein CyaY [Zoogloeaceae bacterium]
MDEQEFAGRARTLLAQLETALEQAVAQEHELDYEWVAEGILEIDCAAGGKIVVNRHAPSREIWIAARRGGFHFRWDGEHWRDSRDGALFETRLRELVAEQTGVDVCF